MPFLSCGQDAQKSLIFKKIVNNKNRNKFLGNKNAKKITNIFSCLGKLLFNLASVVKLNYKKISQQQFGYSIRAKAVIFYRLC